MDCFNGRITHLEKHLTERVEKVFEKKISQIHAEKTAVEAHMQARLVEWGEQLRSLTTSTGEHIVTQAGIYQQKQADKFHEHQHLLVGQAREVLTKLDQVVVIQKELQELEKGRLDDTIEAKVTAQVSAAYTGAHEDRICQMVQKFYQQQYDATCQLLQGFEQKYQGLERQVRELGSGVQESYKIANTLSNHLQE